MVLLNIAAGVQLSFDIVFNTRGGEADIIAVGVCSLCDIVPNIQEVRG